MISYNKILFASSGSQIIASGPGHFKIVFKHPSSGPVLSIGDSSVTSSDGIDYQKNQVFDIRLPYGTDLYGYSTTNGEVHVLRIWEETGA